MVAFLKTKVLNDYLKDLKANDCLVQMDKDAGTCIVKDGETVVLRALQKGRGGAWITRLFKSDRISWA